MKREQIELDKDFVHENLTYGTGRYYEHNGDEYQVIENKITSADSEDGGGWHTLVIQRKSDQRFFRKYYCDWDIEYNFDRDFDGTFSETIAKEKTILVFE
jgi:hypothetical protein